MYTIMDGRFSLAQETFFLKWGLTVSFGEQNVDFTGDLWMELQMCLLCLDDISEMTCRKDRLFCSTVNSGVSRSLVTGNDHQQLISLVSLQFVNIDSQWYFGQVTPRLQNSSLRNITPQPHRRKVQRAGECKQRLPWILMVQSQTYCMCTSRQKHWPQSRV